MKRLPHDLRLATMDERPAFNAANRCIAIRVYPDTDRGKRNEICCGDRQHEKTGGLCIDHARDLLTKDEWIDPSPPKPPVTAGSNEPVPA